MLVQHLKPSQHPLALRVPPVSIFTRISSRSTSPGASSAPLTQSTDYKTTTRSSKSKFLDNFNCWFDVDRHRYHTSSVSQDPNSGEITIKAEKHSDGRITSGKVETKNVWTTASDLAVKNRGYVEVRATMPAKVGLSWRQENQVLAFRWMETSWWEPGQQSGCLAPSLPPGLTVGSLTLLSWPTGCQRWTFSYYFTFVVQVYMTTHSGNHNGGGGQHPSAGGTMRFALVFLPFILIFVHK